MDSTSPPRGPHYEQRKAWMESIRPDNTGKKYKKHKERGPDITPERLVGAIRGSLGVMRRIARRLGVVHQSVELALARPGFEEARAALHEETGGLKFAAVSTLAEMVSQRDEYKTALSAAKFVLDRKGGWGKEITIQGGDRPLRLDTTHHVSLDSLDLPLEVQRQVLEKLEAQSRPLEESTPSRPVLRVRRII